MRAARGSHALLDSRVCAASVGGALAIASSVAGLLDRGNSVTGEARFTVILALAAGILAVARPRRVEFLTPAAVLVGIAIVVDLFGRLGLLYTPSLVLLVIGIFRSEAGPERETLVPETAGPMLATEWERKMRLAEQEATIQTAGAAESLRRAG